MSRFSLDKVFGWVEMTIEVPAHVDPDGTMWPDAYRFTEFDRDGRPVRSWIVPPLVKGVLA